MVHLEDAKATLAAVMRSYWLPGLLPSAFHAIFVLFVLACERCDHTFGDTARVSEGGPDVTQVCHHTEPIKRDEVEETLHCEWDALNELLVNERLLVPVENVSSITNVLPIHD